MGKIKKPTQEIMDYIKNNYSYDPTKGIIYSINRDDIGIYHTTHSRTVIKIHIKNRKYMRAHIAWFLYYGIWPELEIDHEDRDSTNDKIHNLRQIDPDRQQQNKESYKGYKGFSILRQTEENKIRRTQYRVRNKKREINLGYYKDRDSAIEAIDEYWKGRGFAGTEWDFDEN